AGTPFEGRLLNNPDQRSVAYMAMHGIPHQNIGMVQAFITPYREKRGARNSRMADRLNGAFAPFGVTLGYEADVLPLSQRADGGSVTERHILFALCRKLIERFGRGAPLLAFLEGSFRIKPSGGVLAKLLDAENPMYAYYLLGLLKSQLVELFYIDAAGELPDAATFVEAARDAGAIPAYAYLGDVQNSVTGDKKDERFEDEYLDSLVEWLARSGFAAVTFMPTRNTKAQLGRLMDLCGRNGLFQISGEDINTPFQPFVCRALDDPQFAHLITSTWALIGHERAATANIGDGMFAPGSVARLPDLRRRAERYAEFGRGVIDTPVGQGA
ncbi:MAG: PHP domain-containing protein, partial [Clostridiales bacterium]|nr:PHP domain-containing protein [Clostridiales bacterium]